MPEYLAPGVYVEEVSFRAKTIEGVSTSTAGFVGPARYGPIDGTPELITSFAEFERIFGGLDPLNFESERGATNYLAHGVRGFFDNGGHRVYVSRLYTAGGRAIPPPLLSPPEEAPGDLATYTGHAWAIIDPAGPSETLMLIARHPGSGGNFRIGFTFRISQNVFADDVDADVPNGRLYKLKGVNPFDLVWVKDTMGEGDETSTGKLYWAERFFDDTLKRTNWRLNAEYGTPITLNFATSPRVVFSTDQVRRVTMTVDVTYLDAEGLPTWRQQWEDVAFHPAHRQSLAQTFLAKPPTRSLEVSLPFIFFGASLNGPLVAHVLLKKLQDTSNFGSLNLVTSVRKADQKTLEITLASGDDGLRPQPAAYEGTDADPKKKTGLKSLQDIQDISIVAAPGYSWWPDATIGRTNTLAIANMLISHCEYMRYCIAVLDPQPGLRLPDIRAFRAQIDSTRAALYYPFVRILDPVTQAGVPQREVDLPPSGFVTGIYARSDIEQGVHKSPANEVLRGALGFEAFINKGQQDVLNPEGINVLRFFEGRGYRVWGARTATSDPEWKYVNVRRYFLYLERSIDPGTQWCVFENNGDALWANVRRTIEDFLFNEWKSGHLFGTKPEEAYFVRCDRTTMTQNDFDNGRMVCLIGVSPLRPAEFVIFRIGQKTADARS